MISRIVTWIERIGLILVVVFLIGWHAIGGGFPDRDRPDWIGQLFTVGVRQLSKLIVSLPLGLSIAVAGVCLIIVAGRSFIAWTRHHARRDPVRMYSHSQRLIGADRALGRCERDGWCPWVRCRRRAEHADHWYPWSQGGKTSERNLVASCSWHNLTKSGSWPSRAEGRRIARRRKHYWTGPANGRHPGETYTG